MYQFNLPLIVIISVGLPFGYNYNLKKANQNCGWWIRYCNKKV